MSYNPLEPRRFGIELEVSRRLTSVAYESKNQSEEWNKIQLMVRSLGNTNQISPGWKVKVDTSCGGEIVSPILFGQKGLTETVQICSGVRDIAKKSGKISVDGECGLHIHFDAANMTAQQLSKLLIILHKYEPLIYGMYPYRDMKYCAPISLNMKLASRFRDWVDVRDVWYRGSNNIRTPEQFYEDRFINGTSPGEAYDGTRYHGFNIHCYWRQQTVEFRYGPGTFNPIEIAAYYELCLSIFNAAMYGNIKPSIDILNLKYRDISSVYMTPTRMREYLSGFFDLIKLGRKTRKYIIDKLRINYGHCMKKAWDRKNFDNVIIITRAKRFNFIYKDIDSNIFLTADGNTLSPPDTLDIESAKNIVPVIYDNYSRSYASTNPKFILAFELNYKKPQEVAF